MRVALLKVAGIGLLAASQPALGQSAIGRDSLRVSPGLCSPESHTAEGPETADLTKRHSRFFCDSMVTSMVDDQPGHFLIQFASKRAQHSPVLGFGGYLESDGLIHISSIYFEAGVSTPADDGACRFFRNARGQINGVMCGAVSIKDGTKSVAVIVFTPTH